MTANAKSHRSGDKETPTLPADRTPRLNAVQRYFYSGWAFLVPYLGAYLLYRVTSWPVNPGTDGVIPSLLHVYWGLHAIHLVLAGMALGTWWRGADRPSALWTLIPWMLLALFFWIPGVYMEFPADPWQHYARINEWAWHDLVGQHTYWTKSGSFLAYSLIGRIQPPLVQLKWFDVYYTGACLLMCWQYYRLARAVGLGQRPATLFVFLNVLIFGNNIFGFYRYYGMSTTLLAQLGAVAMTRIALETLSHPQLSLRGFFQFSRKTEPASAAPPVPRLFALESPIVAGVLLALVTAFNHIQGLGIAAFGIIAIVCWRLVEWRRSMLAWLALAALLASVATILWYPRHPLIDDLYRPTGWITPWYGFDLFHPTSPAFQRAWVIIGAFGALNLLAGAFLFRRNSVVAWLTWMPLLLLSLPCLAIPIASSLATEYTELGGYVQAYHRMLFALPAMLASASLLTVALGPSVAPNFHPEYNFFGKRKASLAAAIPLLLLALALLPNEGLSFNRLFNSIQAVPEDQRMIQLAGARDEAHPLNGTDPMSASQGIGFVVAAMGRSNVQVSNKWMTLPPSFTIEWPVTLFRRSTENGARAVAFIPSPLMVFSPTSLAGRLSGHWTPNQISLEHISGPAIEEPLHRSAGSNSITKQGELFLTP